MPAACIAHLERASRRDFAVTSEVLSSLLGLPWIMCQLLRKWVGFLHDREKPCCQQGTRSCQQFGEIINSRARAQGWTASQVCSYPLPAAGQSQLWLPSLTAVVLWGCKGLHVPATTLAPRGLLGEAEWGEEAGRGEGLLPPHTKQHPCISVMCLVSERESPFE